MKAHYCSSFLRYDYAYVKRELPYDSRQCPTEHMIANTNPTSKNGLLIVELLARGLS